MNADRRRLTLALLLSLLIHAPLLSLTFGGQSVGLPGFSFPWRERRVETPDLRVVLVPAKVAVAEPVDTSLTSGTLLKVPLQQASIEPAVAEGLTLKPSLALSKTPELAPTQTTEAISPQAAKTELVAPATEATIAPDIATDAVAAITPAPVVIAVERSDAATSVVPLPSPAPAPVIAVAPIAPIALNPENAVPSPRVDATKLETTRQEAARIEAARLEAAQLEAQRQADKLEAARMETARAEATKLEAARQEATRIEAARLEALRQDVVRQAARVEASRLETERREAVQQAATQKEIARALAEKEEDTRRAARREAMGRVLNEEAARRKATEATETSKAAATTARTPSTLPYSLSTARRGRLWGRFDANAELVQYAEAWARKIQLNTLVDTVREVAKRPHTNPMVTVAIRSDGSVESVNFVVSSGVAEIDEAIRRIVQSHAPYQSFPPGLAREFDVIDVRRTWHFDTAIRLY